MSLRKLRLLLAASALAALGLCGLEGCGNPTATAALPTFSPTLLAPIGDTPPHAAPTPRSVSATTAPRATVDPTRTQTFSDPALGIYFAYPKDWTTGPRAADAPPGVFIHSPPFPSDPEPIIFAIVVEVHTVPETSIQQFVDDHLAGLTPDVQSGVQRTLKTVGGEAAEQLTGLPSRDGDIETFILHGGQVFDVILAPYDEGNAQLAPFIPAARGVYEGVLASYTFLK